jgi:hypothetical protein
MNKKFFTLIVSALVLAASFGTANAQIAPGMPVGKFTSFPTGDGRLYQLQATIGVGGTPVGLAVRGDGTLDIDTVSATPVPYSGIYGESLWCLGFKESQAEGQNPTLNITSRSVGRLLQVSTDDAKKPGEPIDIRLGDLGGWGFSATYKNAVQSGLPLYTYFDNDSVLVLGVKASTDTVVVFKDAASRVINQSGYVAPAVSGATALLFTIVTPAPLILSATDFNTILSTQGSAAHKLIFNKDKNKTTALNPWGEQELLAQPSAFGGNWINFAKVDAQGHIDTETFVRVDTLYTNTTGNKYLAFTNDTIVNGLQGQYDFLLRYDVSKDSLSIQVREARFYLDGAKPWHVTTTTDSLYVKLQDLVKADEIRIVTIGNKPAETTIKLNLSCVETTTGGLTSIKEDLYVIHNSAGQVLGVPIYTDSIVGTGVQWLTYDPLNVNPKFIPAYQWVVKKTRSTNPTVSPIKITNREFPDQEVTIQLFSGKKTATLYGAEVDTAGFVAVEKKYKEDQYLGYYHITAEQAKLSTYALNYYHRLNATDYFLGPDEGGSNLVVKSDEKTEFRFTPVSGAVAYGYTVARTGDIADLAQLVRVAYVVTNKTGTEGFESNDEDRYILSTTGHGAFLLKTHNVLAKENDREYFALLDTLAVDKVIVGGHPISYEKVGISDDNLWAYSQVQRESRTSAFHPEVYSAPLYRRFDGYDKYTYGKGQLVTKEPYGDDTNSPVWLKFTNARNKGYQFLSENAGGEYRQGVTNPNLSFLGYKNIDQFKESDSLQYTFFVDTAFSARKLDPKADEFTAKPQYMLALNPDRQKADKVRKVVYEESHYIDADGNPVTELVEGKDTFTYDLPAMVRGYYLFNAQDSVNVGNADYVGNAAYGAKDDVRLAFVDGVHMADTFYVLPQAYGNKVNGKKKVLTSVLQENYEQELYGLAPVYKHYLGENTHYEPRLLGVNARNEHVSDLSKNGKSMVFQFRLIPNENEERIFLIESTTEEFLPDGSLNQMGPSWARWIKLQNDVPVITNAIRFYDVSGQSGAALFNVQGGVVDGATAVKPVATSEVKVISEVGAIQVLNAAGKKVAVSNILGQTVANSVLSSDNARIVLPKGIVVVAVEGEPAIKAIVK